MFAKLEPDFSGFIPSQKSPYANVGHSSLSAFTAYLARTVKPRSIFSEDKIIPVEKGMLQIN